LHNSDHKLQLARFLATPEDTLALGVALSHVLEPGLVVYLIGDLGVGKTTLARGILRGLGFTGRVKSPTFTLVELYKFSKLYLYHFDFYRFDQPQELGEAGFREHFGGSGVCLVEWPEKASGLPPPDVSIGIGISGEGRSAELTATTEMGRSCLERLEHSSTT
jgi:tRNA threonylcarbamoyladenosine biosynthesis protein TsaE